MVTAVAGGEIRQNGEVRRRTGDSRQGRGADAAQLLPVSPGDHGLCLAAGRSAPGFGDPVTPSPCWGPSAPGATALELQEGGQKGLWPPGARCPAWHGPLPGEVGGRSDPELPKESRRLGGRCTALHLHSRLHVRSLEPSDVGWGRAPRGRAALPLVAAAVRHHAGR